MKKIIKKSLVILKNEGPTGYARRVKRKISKQTTMALQQQSINFLVRYEDALKVDWRQDTPWKIQQNTTKLPKNATLNWIMSPPGRGSGGHQNIFRFIKYLETQGFKSRVYYYSSNHFPSLDEIKIILDEPSYDGGHIEQAWMDGPMKTSDAVICTGWETAYPAYLDPSPAKRYYFVQDFEPYFYPISSEYVLAENTYRFGFEGITAGRWLSTKLATDYGMKCTPFDFGVEDSTYKLLNKNKRKEIFFYARPVTARRGFELGIMTLELFAKAKPDYTIVFAGWDVSNYKIPFKHKNLGTQDVSKLPEIYNNCAAALVISLTNLSLLPKELLACGTIPVVNVGNNNQMVFDDPFVHYSEANPHALSEALIAIVDNPQQQAYAAKAAASIGTDSWAEAGRTVAAALGKKS